MRLTRAARRAEAEITTSTDIHIDNTATEHATPPSDTNADSRPPLKEIVINEEEVVEEMPAKKQKKAAKGKGKGRGRKTKKDEVEESLPVEENNTPEVLEDARIAAASPASDAAMEELRNAPEPCATPSLVPDDVTAPTPSRAVRLTRRQLAQAEAQRPKEELQTETKTSAVEHESNEIVVPHVSKDSVSGQTHAPEPSQPQPDMVLQEPPQPIQPIKEILSPLDIPNDQDSIRSLSLSPSRRTPRTEDSIEAMDALEEAMEEIGRTLPLISPGKSRANGTPKVKINGHTPSSSDSSIEHPIPAAKVSRTPKAVKSMKENIPPEGSAKKAAPTPATKTALSRTQSLKTTSRDVSAKYKPKNTGEVVDYLATKRRPVSVSFPAPPVITKSSKPPTKSTFTLPGESVAAKLKAAREARLQKDAAADAAAAKHVKVEPKKPAFKARPAPKVTTSSITVKPTAASLAREAAITGTAPPAPVDKPLARTSSLRASTAGKRQSTLLSPHRPPPKSSLPGVSIPPPTPARPVRPPRPVSLVSRPRSTVPPPPVTKPALTPADVATQKVRGKEIFNRIRGETEEKDRERREKEEAARRARAEAAERGRLASREWAERQRKRVEGVVSERSA